MTSSTSDMDPPNIMTLAVQVQLAAKTRFQTMRKNSNDRPSIEAMQFDKFLPISKVIEQIISEHGAIQRELRSEDLKNRRNVSEMIPRMKIFVPTSLLDSEDLRSRRLSNRMSSSDTKTKSKTTKKESLDKYATKMQTEVERNKEDLSGYWLDNEASLSTYEKRPEFELEEPRVVLMDTDRTLIFKLDGHHEKLFHMQVDESLSIAQIVELACKKAELQADPREYLFSRIDKSIDSGGGVAKSRKDIGMRFGMLESSATKQFSKLQQQIETDENLIWLSTEENLRQQGIGIAETLVLRRRFFGFEETKHIDQAKAKSNNLFEVKQTYTSLQRSIISGTQVVNDRSAILLAALQIIIDSFGDEKEIKKIEKKFQMVNYFPKDLASKRTFKKQAFAVVRGSTEKGKKTEGLLTRHKAECAAIMKTNPRPKDSETIVWAMRMYIATCTQMETYGTQFFMVKTKKQQRSTVLDVLLFGVNKNEVMLKDAKTKQPIGTAIPLDKIKGWSSTDTMFLLDIDASIQHVSAIDNKVCLRTAYGQEIQDLIAGYINLLQQRRKEIEQEMRENSEKITANVQDPNQGIVNRTKSQMEAAIHELSSLEGVAVTEDEATLIENLRNHVRKFQTDVPKLAHSDAENSDWESFYDDVKEFTRRVAMLQYVWKHDDPQRAQELHDTAKGLLDAIQDCLVDKAMFIEKQPIEDFMKVLEGEQFDPDGFLVKNFPLLRLSSRSNGKRLLNAAKGLADSLSRMIDGAMSLDEYYQKVKNDLEIMNACGAESDKGLFKRVQLMQKARDAFFEPDSDFLNNHMSKIYQNKILIRM